MFNFQTSYQRKMQLFRLISIRHDSSSLPRLFLGRNLCTAKTSCQADIILTKW